MNKYIIKITFISFVSLPLIAQPTGTNMDEGSPGSETTDAEAEISTKKTESISNNIYKSPQGELYAGPDVKFQLQSQDSKSGVERIYFRLNNDPELVYTGPFRLPSEGLNRIHYFAEDKNGNREQAHVYHITLDQHAPELAFIFAADTYFEKSIYYIKPDAVILLEAYDDRAGLATVVLHVDGVLQTYAPESAIKISREGSFLIKAQATDHVGNRSNEIIVQGIADGKAPSVRLRGIKPADSTNTNTPIYCPKSGRLELDASDDRSGVRLIQYRRSNESEWRQYTGTIVIPRRAQEVFKIEFRAFDRAGNTSVPGVYSCIFDFKRPTTRIE